MNNIPDNWTLVRMDEVARINPTRERNVSPPETVTFLAMEDVSNAAQVISGNVRPYSEVSSGYTYFADNDVLIAKITPCFENGKGAHVQYLENGTGYGSTEFHVVRTGKRIHDRFLYYLSTGYEFRKRGEANMQGSAGQRRVPTDFIKSYRFPLPPLPEQRKIAEILGMWDKASAATEKLIAALERRKQGLMQRLLTGQVRFGEFGGSEWREVRLGSIFKERKETGFVDLPLLSVTAEEGIVERDSLDKRDTSNSDKSKYLRICPGDIGYNTMRMWQGRSAVSTLEGIVSPAYTVCIPRPTVDVEFMGYLFKFPPVVNSFWRYSQGLVSDTLNLKFPAFSKVVVRIPGLTEQRKIADVLRSCDLEIAGLTKKRDALTTQKKGLMQRLLTGQVRVAG